MERTIRTLEEDKRIWFRDKAAQYIRNSQLRIEHEKVFDNSINRYKDKISVLQKSIHRFLIEKTENIMDKLGINQSQKLLIGLCTQPPR